MVFMIVFAMFMSSQVSIFADVISQEQEVEETEEAIDKSIDEAEPEEALEPRPEELELGNEVQQEAGEDPKVNEDNPLGNIVTGNGTINFDSNTAPLPLLFDSGNTHSSVLYAWMYGDDLYFAIAAMQTVHSITYSYNDTTINSSYVNSADNKDYVLSITENKPDQDSIIHKLGKANEYPGNTSNNTVWNIVKIPNSKLVSKFNIIGDIQGGGHSIDGYYEIGSDLQVYHDYQGLENPILDVYQSGSLKINSDGKFYYEVEPKPIYNEEVQELVKILIEHNGSKEPDKYPIDLMNNKLYGEVGNIDNEASAKVTFVYEKIVKSNITIKKEVTGNFGDYTREFNFTAIVGDEQESFNLKHEGNPRIIENLKPGQVIKLKENNVPAGYEVTVAITSGQGVISGPDNDDFYTITVGTEAITITVTNHLEVPIDTGITLDSMPYILILGLASIGLGVKFVQKRNIYKKN